MNEGLQRLYEQFAPLVYRRCRSILRNDEEAVDGVQEVFLRLAERPSLLRGVRSPTAYLYRMATNYALNRLRRERRSPTLPDDAAEAGTHDQQALARALLERLFQKVSPRTRELAWFRWVDGMTWEETALASGLSVSGVRKHLARFSTLAQGLEEDQS